jgi:DNA helicase-2/ATP-dependent DNA helicase PcrA
MMGEPSLTTDLGSRFDHILIDEYQDTNRLQASILFGIKPNGRGLTVVGDDAQSIYSFRAATVRNILDFPLQFRPRAQIITLERNYRSTQPILAAANAVIGLAEERFTKELWSERVSSEKPWLVSVRDEADQAQYVAERVLENREQAISLKSQVVLFRASHHSAQLEIELTRRNIPFVKFGGLKFLEAAHIKDVLAILRWVEFRDRISGFRVLQLLPGIGPATAARILERISQNSDALNALKEFSPPAASAEAWRPFLDTFELVHGDVSWPSEIEAICRWYQPHLERIYEDAALRQADLLQLGQIVSTYATRERFLTELTLDPPDRTSETSGIGFPDLGYCSYCQA